MGHTELRLWRGWVHQLVGFGRREPVTTVRPPFRGPLRVATFNVGMMSTFIDSTRSGPW